MSISASQITDVLTLQDMFTRAGTPYDPTLLADIIEWADNRSVPDFSGAPESLKLGEPFPDEGTTGMPKAKSGKGTESGDSDSGDEF